MRAIATSLTVLTVLALLAPVAGPSACAAEVLRGPVVHTGWALAARSVTDTSVAIERDAGAARRGLGASSMATRWKSRGASSRSMASMPRSSDKPAVGPATADRASSNVARSRAPP